MIRRATALALAAAALAGCYPGRLTSNYDSVFEINNTDDDSAILEESGRDEIAEARIMKRLMELEMEEEPVYHRNAGDKIEIRVYGHDDIGMVTKIGPDGTVGIAFVGQIKLSGCSLADGADKIREGLAPYVKNPVVSITILEVLSETATSGTTKTVERNLDELDAAALEIENNAGTVLPSTGGMGTTILYVVGGVMVAGAAVYLLTKKRASSMQ